MKKLDKKPLKQKTVVRFNPFSGDERTVTKSKSVDSQGTVTKKRSVTREALTDRADLSTTKSKVKEKFADGTTRKVKSLSSSTGDYRGPHRFKTEKTAVKEKTSGKGIVNKLKSLVKPSDKKAYSSVDYNKKFERGNQTGYRSAKKTFRQVSRNIKKG
jgi:hypothetical protein